MLQVAKLQSWILTDGKAGDETQCLGVAEAMGLAPQVRRVAPRAPWVWAMPWGPIDPAEAPGRAGSPIAPPFPDLLIASGRRAVPYVRHVKRASRGRTFTVILKDPRSGTDAADLIWVPEHDRLRGPNVITSLTSPHRISAARLDEARATPDPRLDTIRPPRVAVLAGGPSRHHAFTTQDITRFLDQLRHLAAQGAGLMITASRRTPPPLAEGLRQLARDTDGFFWDGSGDNPYIAMLARAEAVVVTADSTNMVGEAAATGRPVLVFEPAGGHRKIAAFLNAMKAAGIVHGLSGSLEFNAYPPLNVTETIAAAIGAALVKHRDKLGL